MNVKDVAYIIQAYEDIRMGGDMDHMEHVYGLSGDHKTYLEKKHRRHIDFVPFNGYLDSIRKQRYAKLIADHAKYLSDYDKEQVAFDKAMGGDS
mgnify:CR=1 FL=1